LLPTDAYTVRAATAADLAELVVLAELDGQAPISGPALVADVAGLPTAAISLRDGRVIADPYQDTAALASILRVHVASLAALRRRRRFSDRLLDAMPVPGRRTSTG
jgi:hypothetical protein